MTTFAALLIVAAPIPPCRSVRRGHGAALVGSWCHRRPAEMPGVSSR
jgi:hypothetical protein